MGNTDTSFPNLMTQAVNLYVYMHTAGMKYLLN